MAEGRSFRSGAILINMALATIFFRRAPVNESNYSKKSYQKFNKMSREIILLIIYPFFIFPITCIN